MDVTISLSPEEAAQLRTKAQKRGLPLSDFVKSLVTAQAEETSPENPSLALFDQWNAEDAAVMTAEEIEAEKQLWAEFEQGINTTRRSMGMREL